MKSRSIILNVILWVEIIVSARVLMFTLPVLITKYTKGQYYNVTVSDWAILIVTIIAAFYFVTGIAAVLKYKGWKLFHYLGFFLTALLTVGLVKKALSMELAVSWGFFLPLLISASLAMVAISYERQAKPLI
ncbi:MAG TPA: hypothetical protein VI749_09340 [Candidatus Omnitrophota bacterium]|nr:hypothetical protein [Candidatus Omnitrophota bacterium]